MGARPRGRSRGHREPDRRRGPHTAGPGARPGPGADRGRGRRFARRVACYAWASPTTSLGLLAGLLTLASGGGARVRRGALEFHGGFSRWFGGRCGFEAMTLGHVILGRSAFMLDVLRDHEQAHVRQVERWGPAFIPAYLIASYLAWRRGGHYYLDNWFERDARRAAGEDRR
ncbi:hypothetical protein OJF2_14880 [Aquisphaera giovannonii]|uniref:Uncharacterized protein n=1 Tax=Aquisphaera giovannonii TaxID=406548 RepID=A0A5B9VX87_9BACT|nr:hypothetical protein [Aquisphaera giovannonii]QEH32996.1 hypothetical protein OJF2_14880 [Aquisphaera giovannonii]